MRIESHDILFPSVISATLTAPMIRCSKRLGGLLYHNLLNLVLGLGVRGSWCLWFSSLLLFSFLGEEWEVPPATFWNVTK